VQSGQNLSQLLSKPFTKFGSKVKIFFELNQ
jgi:hypothetical protein